jgi:hypothetical protein
MARRSRHRITINKRRWLLDIAARIPSDRWGDCDDPQKKRRRIRVSKTAKGITWLEVLIHELIHARWWALCETEVTAFSKELVAILVLLRARVIEVLEEEEED